MRAPYLVPMLALLSLPLAAQGDPDKAVAGGGTLPAGWQARADKDVPLTNVKFAPMGNGFHVTLGPAVILYRPADQASGNYHVVASLTRTKATAHPESYGLFIAGKDLASAGQSYVYFLVRADGSYLIKRRTGETTANISEGWTKSAAVMTEDDVGKATDKLEVTVADGKATFTVNGKTVHTMSGEFDGIAGLRVNHNLDVHIDGFGVHKM